MLSLVAEQLIEPRAAFHRFGLARLFRDTRDDCLVFRGSQAGRIEAGGVARNLVITRAA